MNVLGVEARTQELIGAGRFVRFFDFTVDGESLCEIFESPNYITLLDDDSYNQADRVESLQRLLGLDVLPPDFSPRYDRTWLDRVLGMKGTPYASWATAFEDGRIGLLFCPCGGDLDCGALSTRLEMTRDRVIWHDVGWQVTYEPFEAHKGSDYFLVTTFEFEREQYEKLLRSLLEADWTAGLPSVA